MIGRGDYHWQHEPCWYAVRNKGHWTGDRKQTTLWTIASGGQDTETAHGTQKPVECMRRPMLNNSTAGDAVYEPFLGSGTTLIAAESTGRVCFAMELDPAYVDVGDQALAGVQRRQGDVAGRRPHLRRGRRGAPGGPRRGSRRTASPVTAETDGEQRCAAADLSRPASNSSPATQGNDP